MMSKKLKHILSRFKETWETDGAKGVFSAIWTRFWMRFAGLSLFGRIATRLATWMAPPYLARCCLAGLYSKGYIAPSATIHHAGLRLGAHVCINDRVIIYQSQGGGPVELGDRVVIHHDTIIQTGECGDVFICSNTHIHPRCILSAYKAPIHIGFGVLIAPNCSFYSYNHGIFPDDLIRNRPKQTKGAIIIEDDAWLGFGVIVLDGVRIGKGAVIGAGAVVTHDVPDGAIAMGNPARVVKMRSELKHKISEEKYEAKENVSNHRVTYYPSYKDGVSKKN